MFNLLILLLLVSDPGFIVEWRVRWEAPLKPKTYTKKFKDLETALIWAGNAPMCKDVDGNERPAPCVEWIKVYEEEVRNNQNI